MNCKVIIITLNYNQNKYTLDCIDSLLKSEYSNFKILLIDNGSKDENVKDLENRLPKDQRIIFHQLIPNRGYVGGVNFGLEEGAKLSPDYFLIMNNDTIIAENSISELFKTCQQNENKAVVTGKVCDYNNPNRIQDIGYVFKSKKYLSYNQVGLGEIDYGQHDTEVERDLIDDIFWLFPAKLYNQIGGYSNHFWFNGEQADFAMRAKNIKYKLIYSPKAKLLHKGSISVGGRNMNPAQVYWATQSSLILRFLHLRKIYFIHFYLKVITSIIRTFIKSTFIFLFRKQNTFTYAYAKLKGLLYFNRWVLNKMPNNGKNPFLNS